MAARLLSWNPMSVAARPGRLIWWRRHRELNINQKEAESAMKTVWILLAAVVSVALSEIAVFIWLDASGGFLDVTANFWLYAVIPASFLVVSLQAFALQRIHRANPLRYGLIYAIAYPVLHGLGLNFAENPPGDLATYLVIDGGLAALVLTACHRFFWRRNV